jgi:hypothetical protein
VADRHRAQKARSAGSDHPGRGRTADRRRARKARRRFGRPPVSRWQRRFAEAGFGGLLRDATRKPGKARPADATVRRVVTLAGAEPPGEATWGTGRTRAQAAALSLGSGPRLWSAHPLQPRRIHTLKRSTLLIGIRAPVGSERGIGLSPLTEVVGACAPRSLERARSSLESVFQAACPR